MLTFVRRWIQSRSGAYWHNRMLDQAAAEINRERPEVFWRAWQQLSDALLFHRQLHRDILRVLLQTGRKAMAEQQAAPSFRKVECPGQEVEQYSTPGTWQLPTKMFARHGRANVCALHEWWSAIGHEVMGGTGELTYVSGIQLYLDFYLTTKTFWPMGAQT